MAATIACGGGSTGGGEATPTLYDDFSAGISGAKWNNGQHLVGIVDQAAQMTESVVAVQANGNYRTTMKVLPTTGNTVTALQAEIRITAAEATGDTVSSAAIDFEFQPVANRISAHADMNAVFVRLILQRTTSALTAVRKLYACTNADCTTSIALGSTVAGSWPTSAVAIDLDTTYTLGITFDTATNRFTYSLSGGGLTAISETRNTAGLPAGCEISAASFYGARLYTRVYGGASGGGNGSITARFDNVRVAMDGGALALHDDFNIGDKLDGTKWTVGSRSAQIVGSGATSKLQLSLNQIDSATNQYLNLTNAAVSALQADVTVTQASLTGPGRVSARLYAHLYNDGSNGSGTAPDTNSVGSDVGDVVARINMTDTDVYYAVLRCNDALCSTATAIQSNTSMGTVTLGTTHTLLLKWDATGHQVTFQLDTNAPVSFDPVAAGYPVASGPNVPMRQIAVSTGSSGPSPSEQFGPGSSGSITATFANVKTLP